APPRAAPPAAPRRPPAPPPPPPPPSKAQPRRRGRPPPPQRPRHTSALVDRSPALPHSSPDAPVPGRNAPPSGIPGTLLPRQSMQKLVQGIHHFQSNIFSSQRDLFERLANEQHPEALFITCSDS